MIPKTAQFYECTCKYEKLEEDGLMHKTTETDVVDALSFGDAENRFIEEMQNYVNGSIDVTAIKIAPYKEVFFMDDEPDGHWYKAKVAFITLNEKTGKEKKTNVCYLVEAQSLDKAVTNINSALKDSMMDYLSIAVTETKIVEVFMKE